MHPFELASHPSRTPECAKLRTGLAVDGVDLHIGAIGDVDVFLRPVFRQHEIPHRAVLQGLWFDLKFLDEGAVFLEHLDTVVGAVADIHQPVARDPDAVHRARERLRQVSDRDRLVGRQFVIDRCLGAVGAPVAFIRTGLGIEHDDPAIAVAVCDIEFARRVVGDDVRRAAKLRR